MNTTALRTTRRSARLRAALLSMSAALFGLTVSHDATAQTTPIIIKFSHVASIDSPKGLAAERFKKLAEERTGGRVRVELYPNSALYKDKEELEALQVGAVQMLAPSISKFGPFGVKEFEVFDLPFVTPDIASFQRVAASDFGLMLLKKLEVRGVRGLAYWDAGFRIVTSSKPLHGLADFKGQKIRINSSKVIEAEMRSIGAIPQTLAFSEVYQALQTGVVDGADTIVSNAYTQKFYEVQKHINLLHHSHQAYAVVTNRKFWDGLPPDVRAALETAMADATTYGNAMSVAEETSALDRIKASGRTTLYTPTAAEREEIKKAMMVVHRDMETRLGRDNILAMYKAAGFVPPK